MTDASAVSVDLDDSHVRDVRREHGLIAIELEQCRGSTKKRILVIASSVIREDAEYYIGHNIMAPHPDPALPLDYIEFAELGSGYLELGGHLKRESWFVWRISSADIQIKDEN